MKYLNTYADAINIALVWIIPIIIFIVNVSSN